MPEIPDDQDNLIARVNIPIPIPSKDEILATLREQIPQVLKADVHAEITRLYTRGVFENLVEEAAKNSFHEWLNSADRASGLSREQVILDRFHHFMTEEVAGPRTRQDYLLKILLTAYPDLAKKLAERAAEPRIISDETVRVIESIVKQIIKNQCAGALSEESK